MVLTESVLLRIILWSTTLLHQSVKESFFEVLVAFLLFLNKWECVDEFSLDIGWLIFVGSHVMCGQLLVNFVLGVVGVGIRKWGSPMITTWVITSLT